MSWASGKKDKAGASTKKEAAAPTSMADSFASAREIDAQIAFDP